MGFKDLLIFILIYYFVFLGFLSSNIRNNSKIIFFDVGQGDSALLVTSKGRVLMIDGGDGYTVDWELVNNSFFPFCNIQNVMVTHPHSDHLEGVFRISKRCSIKSFTFNDVDYSSKLWEDFTKLIPENKKNITYFKDEMYLDNFYLKFYWPSREFIDAFNRSSKSSQNINNVSQVLLVKSGSFEALFLGDAEVNVLSLLDISDIKKHIDGSLDVIKVSHHGAQNGAYKPLYEGLKPSICIVSVGSDNSFGHPDDKFINYLKSINCDVRRTDKLGTIVIPVPRML